MDESVVEKSLADAKSFLSGDAVWINDSYLHLRAFYLGLHVGLRQFANETDRGRILLEMFVRTMSARAGDDLFGASALGVKLRGIREQLYRGLDRGREMKSPLGDHDVQRLLELAVCIDQLDEKWRFHCDIARRELGRIMSDVVSPEEALRVIERLDSSFRESFRALTERCDDAAGS